MISLMIQYWEVTLTVIIILSEIIARIFDRNRVVEYKFEFTELPALKPIRIPTVGKGVFSALRVWIFVGRKWTLAEDFHYKLNGANYVVPQGFVTDGSSIPKFLRAVISPTGILLAGGLVHDYGYKYAKLKLADGSHTEKYTQKKMDQIFRDINIQVNGFKSINYLAYKALRIGGFLAWNKHRKHD